MAAKTRSGVLLILCGLPASGKTYISNLLVQSASCHNFHFFHVCYDDLIPSNLNLQSEELCRSSENSTWKYYRKLVIACVDKVISQFMDTRTVFDDKETGDKDLPSFDDFWEDFLKNQTRRKRTCSCCFSHPQSWSDVCHVFVMDDNMFYRSMRHEYFVLARKYSLGYAQVYFECPLELAIETNSQRPNPVDTKTMVTMATKMEPPSPEKYGWEINSIKFDRKDILGSPTCSLQKLFTLIKTAEENPEQPTHVEDEAEKEKSRMALLANVLYQVDQTLRKIISGHMKCAKERGLTKQQMKTLAEEQNTKRKQFLDDLKSASSLSNNKTNTVRNQKEFKLVDIQEHLAQLSMAPRDRYMYECQQMLQSSINITDHFDSSVKYMFESYDCTS